MRSNDYFISLFLFLFSFSTVQADEAQVGVLAFVKGSVFIDGKRAQNGAELNSSSTITTSDGSCTLLIGETTVVHMSQNAQIEMKKYLKGAANKEDIEISLKVGEVKALIGSRPNREKNFRVRSRSHIMGVRGTEIFVSVPVELDAPVTFLTLEGSAEIVGVTSTGASTSSGDVKATEEAVSSDRGGAPADAGAQTSVEQKSEAPIVLTANQVFRPGEAVQIVTPERAADISRSVGPAPSAENRPGQPMPPARGPGPDTNRMPPPIDLPFRPGDSFGGPGLPPLDPTLDRLVPQVPVQIQFDPD